MTTRKHSPRRHAAEPPKAPANPTAQAFRDAAATARARAAALNEAAGRPPDDATSAQIAARISDCGGWADDCLEQAKRLDATAGLLDGSALPAVPE